jgi:hypothetical protein
MINQQISDRVSKVDRLFGDRIKDKEWVEHCAIQDTQRVTKMGMRSLVRVE